MSDRIQIEPVIGWPAYCDEIMSKLSLAQLEVSNLKVEVVDLTMHWTPLTPRIRDFGRLSRDAERTLLDFI